MGLAQVAGNLTIRHCLSGILELNTGERGWGVGDTCVRRKACLVSCVAA